MYSDRLHRPSFVDGFYPEREDDRLSSLDRFFGGVAAWLETWLPQTPYLNRAFVGQVGREGRKLSEKTEFELRGFSRALSSELKIKGFSRQRIVTAFALIRELADRKLGTRPYDVQLMGGYAMLRGQIAEMDTGEGKTLAATLPAATMALASVPVHIVTVNDFLAERDAETMKPLFGALGLSVGVILEGMSPEERRAAYSCDITYCTNKQLAFDYLKDRLILEQERRPLHMALDGLTSKTPRKDLVLMRGLCFAIIDEVDSVLVDEARTPLVITRPGDMSEMEETFRRSVELAQKLMTPRDFLIDQGNWNVKLTDLGKATVARLSSHWGGIWATDLHREEMTTQALAALYLYEADKHYIVKDARIQIVDEYTGRIMADRSWERGLHQMIEVKEGLEITGRQETLIRISYQRFFRRYMRLSGMTGTAHEIAAELRAVYRLKTQRIPSNKRSRRRARGHHIFATTDQKWVAIENEIARLHRRDIPVLIGTRSVATSEHLSERLHALGLRHSVLNARHDAEEAAIIAEAGQMGAITVATNMTGRGTDIRLGKGVRDLGGLHVLMTERHDSSRIDRQLFGRCGRQGDPGAMLVITSLEDDLITSFYGRKLNFLKRAFGRGGGRLPGLIGRPLTKIAQRAVEQRHSSIRKNLLRADENLEDLLAFSGRSE